MCEICILVFWYSSQRLSLFIYPCHISILFEWSRGWVLERVNFDFSHPPLQRGEEGGGTLMAGFPFMKNRNCIEKSCKIHMTIHELVWNVPTNLFSPFSLTHWYLRTVPCSSGGGKWDWVRPGEYILLEQWNRLSFGLVDILRTNTLLGLWKHNHYFVHSSNPQSQPGSSKSRLGNSTGPSFLSKLFV